MGKYNKNATKLANKMQKLVVQHYLIPAGNYLNKAIHDGLDEGKDIDDNRFAPLSETTKFLKGHDQILFDSGKLKDSIHKDPATVNKPIFTLKVVGPAKEYGALHNTGGTNEQGFNVPQRKWFGIPKELKPDGETHKKFVNEVRLRVKTSWR